MQGCAHMDVASCHVNISGWRRGLHSSWEDDSRAQPCQLADKRLGVSCWAARGHTCKAQGAPLVVTSKAVAVPRALLSQSIVRWRCASWLYSGVPSW